MATFAAVVVALLALGVTGGATHAQAEPQTVGPVTNLVATTQGQQNGTVKLTWTAAENAQVHFVVYLKSADVGSGNYSVAKMVAFNGTEGVISGLEGGIPYHFITIGMRWNWVEYGTVWGSWSEWIATPQGISQPALLSPAPSTEPSSVGRVTNLTASTDVQEAGAVRLMWTAAENAQVHFVVYLQSADLADGNYALAQMAPFNDSEGTISGLEGGTSYHFIAIGMRWNWVEYGTVWGDWSQWVSATPARIPGREDLYQPIQPPVTPAYMDWRWETFSGNFRELVTDFTIHNDVGDWSDEHGYYLILIQNSISGAGFYFGLQTDANGRGKGVIFSRWGTRDLSNARWDETQGWTESAGHEGNFIGVRRSYNWGAKDYRMRIAPDGRDADGEWFSLWITDLTTEETTWIGSLKFPLRSGTAANFRPHASATIELYGDTRIRPIDAPQWHVSVKPPVGDGFLPANWGFTSYPFDASENALPNSDVRYDSSDGAAHLRVGGPTQRETAVGLWIAFWFEEYHPALADAIKQLPWVADGVDDPERAAVEALIESAIGTPDMFHALLRTSWVQDSITVDERKAIWALHWAADTAPALANQMLMKSWVQDGITRDEARVIDRLGLMVRESEQHQLIEKAIEILSMPFLDSVDSMDAMAVGALTSLMQVQGIAEFLAIMAHPTLSDGITDAETIIVVLLPANRAHQPHQVNVLLDGTDVYFEERTITLPLSGKMPLTIVRLSERRTPSKSMDLLVHSIRTIEAFMGDPFPARHVLLSFDDATPGRAAMNYGGDYIAMSAYFDERDLVAGLIAHESAHYYWTVSSLWITEGAANFLAYVAERARIGTPIQSTMDGTYCNTVAPTIAQLEALGPTRRTSQEVCNYYLGERLFIDLYHALGEETFRRGFRSLYLKSQQDDPTDACEDTYLGLCHLEAAFKDGVSTEIAAKVDEVVARWYYGTGR